jgi:hypothetical protein
MDTLAKDTIVEALNTMRETYSRWLGMRVTTDAERELAREKIKRVEHALDQMGKTGPVAA